MESTGASFSRGSDRTVTIAALVAGIIGMQLLRSLFDGWLVHAPLAPAWAWAAVAIPQILVWGAAIILSVWRMVSDRRAVMVPVLTIAASGLCFGLSATALYLVG